MSYQRPLTKEINILINQSLYPFIRRHIPIRSGKFLIEELLLGGELCLTHPCSSHTK